MLFNGCELSLKPNIVPTRQYVVSDAVQESLYKWVTESFTRLIRLKTLTYRPCLAPPLFSTALIVFWFVCPQHKVKGVQINEWTTHFKIFLVEWYLLTSASKITMHIESSCESNYSLFAHLPNKALSLALVVLFTPIKVLASTLMQTKANWFHTNCRSSWYMLMQFDIPSGSIRHLWNTELPYVVTPDSSTFHCHPEELISTYLNVCEGDWAGKRVHIHV